MTAWNSPVPFGSGAPEPVLVSIGDINCTAHYAITPAGCVPINQVSWIVTDQTRTETRIPPVAIVLAVIFFVFCLLGLLFLLMKETRTFGQLQITAQAPGFLHSTYVPISNEMQRNDIFARVNYARSLRIAAQ